MGAAPGAKYLKMFITSWKKNFFLWDQKKKHYLRSYMSKKSNLCCVTRDFEKRKNEIRCIFLVKIWHFSKYYKNVLFLVKIYVAPPWPHTQPIKFFFVWFFHKINSRVVRIHFVKKLDKKNNFRANDGRFTSANSWFPLNPLLIRLLSAYENT